MPKIAKVIDKVEDVMIDFVLEPYIKAFATLIFFGAFAYGYASSYCGWNHLNYYKKLKNAEHKEVLNKNVETVKEEAEMKEITEINSENKEIEQEN
jgi:hypothetical protein